MISKGTILIEFIKKLEEEQIISIKKGLCQLMNV